MLARNQMMVLACIHVSGKAHSWQSVDALEDLFGEYFVADTVGNEGRMSGIGWSIIPGDDVT